MPEANIQDIIPDDLEPSENVDQHKQTEMLAEISDVLNHVGLNIAEVSAVIDATNQSQKNLEGRFDELSTAVNLTLEANEKITDAVKTSEETTEILGQKVTDSGRKLDASVSEVNELVIVVNDMTAQLQDLQKSLNSVSGVAEVIQTIAKHHKGDNWA